MILVLGSPTESIVEKIYRHLRHMNAPAVMISPSDIPRTVNVSLFLEGRDLDGHFSLPDSTIVSFTDITCIYNRFGFCDFEVFTEYTREEADFVNAECSAMLSVFLDHARCPVINKPVSSSSNASKPYQISLIREFGFKVPRTLVSNDADSVKEFYRSCSGRIIYKSISYTRSVVQKMTDGDLERLHTLAYTPVQLQELIEGNDMRVHVVGNTTFASSVASEKSDYRYDKQVQVEAVEIPADLAARCVALARGLGLTLAGIDLRRTPCGDYYCFEVNPSPVFNWYESHTGQPITDALCEVLMDPRAHLL